MNREQLLKAVQEYGAAAYELGLFNGTRAQDKSVGDDVLTKERTKLNERRQEAFDRILETSSPIDNPRFSGLQPE